MTKETDDMPREIWAYLDCVDTTQEQYSIPCNNSGGRKHPRQADPVSYIKRPVSKEEAFILLADVEEELEEWELDTWESEDAQRCIEHLKLIKKILEGLV